MHRTQNPENKPIAGNIYDAEIVNIINAGYVVKLKNFTKNYEGFVYKNHVNSELEVGFAVRIEVVAINGDFISLSMKDVVQPLKEQQKSVQPKRNFVVRLSSPERNYDKVVTHTNSSVNIKITNTEPLFLRQLKAKYRGSGEQTKKPRNTFLDRIANQKNNPNTNNSAADPLSVYHLQNLLSSHSRISSSNLAKNHAAKGKMTIEQQRESLPIYARKDDFIRAIVQNQILVVVGETGSGKTTQLTQYLVEAGFGMDRVIGCTQPRRMAAFSVAKRVAEECRVRLGDFVGFKIRFEDMTTQATCIKYMTDGILLRECLSDKNLEKYSVIILDEAHERTADTDVLMGLLRSAVKCRPKLKLIIASATLDSGKFSEYFYDAPIFKVDGRAFSVDIKYSPFDIQDYFKDALQKVMQIHLTENPGDILLFLTGQEEIERACEYLEEAMSYLGSRVPELVIIPVYAALPPDLQTRIFEEAPEGGRKVIIATNIAECSLTVDGVVYVIDCGFIKQKTFNPRTGMDSLVITPISQATAKQRAGRAGRTGPGKCFRLYTQQSFNEMLKTTIPEIQRTNLASSVLKLKVMGINDIASFELMDPPSFDAMFDALKQLYLLNALDDNGLVTKEGIQMARLPLDPNLSKMFLKSQELRCTDEIATIVAMLSVQNIFFSPRKRRQIANEKKAQFHQSGGDHLTLLEVYKKCERANFSKQWCRENYVQEKALLEARDIRDQLLGIMEQENIEIISAGKNFERIQKAVCAGFIHHAAKKAGERPSMGYTKLTDEEKIFIHPSSALFHVSPSWIVYTALVETTKKYVRDSSAIDPKWLLELAPSYYKVKNNYDEITMLFKNL